MPRGGKVKWTDEKVLAEGRKYTSRDAFCRGSRGAYKVAVRLGLLDQLYPRSLNDWSKDADVIAEGRKYSSRKAFSDAAGSAYTAARHRKLLDQIYPSKYPTWSNDEKVLTEGRKYASRIAFFRGASGAYKAALRRGLLDSIKFPEDNSPSDNDAVYIWRAVGQYFNGEPVYKIGVTSARLGVTRIKQVAKKSGFKFELICCKSVSCRASGLEKKLHLLGGDPQFIGFDGATEFRALSDSALWVALSMINSSL